MIRIFIICQLPALVAGGIDRLNSQAEADLHEIYLNGKVWAISDVQITPKVLAARYKRMDIVHDLSQMYELLIGDVIHHSSLFAYE